MKFKSLITAISLGILISVAVHAETPAEKFARMQWYNDARFGMFIHFGVYSEGAGNFKGKPVSGFGEWIQSGGQIPEAEYRAELLPKFNPVNYDPEAIVMAAKNAGMKYIVITSKHHDGFCLWDSKLTDWDVMSSPYKKDLLKPLAKACAKYGIKFCVYYSIMDWSNPDYGTKAPWRGNANNPKPDMDRYDQYIKEQLKELVNNYHPAILWFDGEWEDAWTHERGVDLYNYLRKLDPKIIINNRIDKGREATKGMTTSSEFKGDYGTPEQTIPAQGLGKDVSWESCMTINDTWGFRAADTHWKSSETLIRNLIDIASKGGNYLLNVGPNGQGEIPAASIDRLAAIGAWMKINGESIHGTTASMFSHYAWDGCSTTRHSKDGSVKIYLQIFKRPEGGKLVVENLMTRPKDVMVLGQSAKLNITGKEGMWNLQLPASGGDSPATVVVLSFDREPVVK